MNRCAVYAIFQGLGNFAGVAVFRTDTGGKPMRFSHSRGVRSVILFSAFAVLGSAFACSSDDGNGGGNTLAGGTTGKGGTIGFTGGNGSGGKGSGSGGTPIMTTGGSSSGGTGNVGGNLDPDAACASTSRQSSKAVVALLFMVDVSGSMYCTVPEADPDNPCTGHSSDPDQGAPSWRWNELKPALKDFFSSSSSAGMWAGIDFFSGNISCDSGEYEDMEAEIALLPGAATAINTAIDGQDPEGQTPTVPSLTGAVAHAQDWEATHPDHAVVIVYATDGYPMGCGNNNTIDNAADIAAGAYDDDGIRTYVLGVGPNLDDLDRIAQSGGTTTAFHIDTNSANVTEELAAAFNEIRMDVAVECTYNLPDPPAGEQLDLMRVNVTYTNGSGNETTVGFNGDANCTEGWQYANNNTQIVLCGSTCDMVKADNAARIDVAFGCSTVIVDPPR
jgi:hypothetical protein